MSADKREKAPRPGLRRRGGGPTRDPDAVRARSAPQRGGGDSAESQSQGSAVEPGPTDAAPYEGLFAGSNAVQGAKRRSPAKPPLTTTQRAIGLLTRREHSRKELTRKLVTRGLDPAEVDIAVAKLSDAGWQDDGRFAASLVRARASGGYGPLHIRAELATHDLPQFTRDAAFDTFQGDWLEVARDLVRRRFARIEDGRLRDRKSLELLTRRGFPLDIGRRALGVFEAD